MDSFERILMAINHKEPDRIPLDLGGTESTSISLKAYSMVRDYFGLPKKEPAVLSFGGQLAQPDSDICDLLGVDTRRITRHDLSDWSLNVEETDGAWFFKDEWGAKWKMPKNGFYFDMVGHPLKDADFEAVKKYKWPNGKDISISRGLAEHAVEIYSRSKAALVLDARIGNGFFHTGALLEGYQDFFTDLLLSPEKTTYILDKVLELKLDYFDVLLNEVGKQIHVIRELDDLGGQNGLLISPEEYRKYIKPRQRILFDFIKKKAPNAKLLFHSCGSIYQIIPDLIELGVDIINPVQVSAAFMDTKRLKREFGKDITFWGGGIDTQNILPKGKSQEVRDEVKRRIDDLAPGGGFVFATVHNIQEDVPIENIIALFESIKDYGSYR